MISRVCTMLLVAALAALPAVAKGQKPPPPVRSLVPTERSRIQRDKIPESHLPPKGMCRIWIDNVPPSQQPAPTDCASAIKNRPSNGRVIFSEEDERGERGALKDSAEEKSPRKGRDSTIRKPRRP